MEMLRPALRPQPVPAPSALPPLADAWLPVVGERTAPLLRQVSAWARRDDLILLRGPTGAGKTRLARWIHARSPRADGPFVTLDLLGSPKGLRESALFGHARGAFTSADSARVGRLQEAQNGTLFIDELDKLDLDEQAMLLRLLDDHQYREVGGTRDRSANVRFVASTNADLERCVAQGLFRADLYYRVQVLPVYLPSLDERRDEIPGWADFLAQEIHQRSGAGGSVGLSPGAIRRLMARTWPGNLRELKNALHRAHAAAAEEEWTEVLTLREHHIHDLAPLPSPSTGDAVQQLCDLARQILARIGQPGQDAIASLETWEGLPGFVVALAAANHGLGPDLARTLGLDAQVRGGNYRKTLRRELTRSIALCAAMGQPAPGFLVAALGGL